MRILLSMLLLFVVLVLLVVGGGIAIGLVLHWLLPAVDQGIGILTGVIATIFVFQMVGRMISFAGMLGEEDPEPEVISPVTYIVDQLPPAPPRRTGKRRRSSEGRGHDPEGTH